MVAAAMEEGRLAGEEREAPRNQQKKRIGVDPSMPPFYKNS